MTENEKKKVLEFRAAGMRYKTISEKLELPPNTVKGFYVNNLIEVDKTLTKTCAYCGKTIKQDESKHFCSDDCKDKWQDAHNDLVKKEVIISYTCKHCGKEFKTYCDTRRKYCSHECYIKHRFW